jgi:hypothetical protein
MGTINIGKVRQSFEGTYSASTAYTVLDTVLFSGESYVCIQATTAGTAPTNTTHWQKIAAKGADGADGADGSDGATGATGPQGTTGAAGPTGSQGPAGNDGATGAQGAAGAAGPTGPQGLTGPTGAQGADGNDGATGATGPQGAAGPQGATGSTSYDAGTLDGIDSSQFLRSDVNDTSSAVLSANYLRGNRLYSAADGSTGYFFNDSGTRTAYAGGDFYIQSSVDNCYIYATNTYLGNTSGDTILLRGNAMTHNGWSAQADGNFRFNDSKKLFFGNGSDVELFFSGSHFYIDLEAGGNNMYIRDGGTTRFTFDDAGHFTATGNVTAYSDKRLKDDIQPIEGALEKVSTLSGNTYQRNDLLDKDPERRYAGVIAQEVEVVLPEAVSEAEDGTKTVDYNAVIALLVESIKELKAEVEQLKGGS